jgi:hypothetical protein
VQNVGVMPVLSSITDGWRPIATFDSRLVSKARDIAAPAGGSQGVHQTGLDVRRAIVLLILRG